LRMFWIPACAGMTSFYKSINHKLPEMPKEESGVKEVGGG
jgi:hypothetical protein